MKCWGKIEEVILSVKEPVGGRSISLENKMGITWKSLHMLKLEGKSKSQITYGLFE